jgi:hypothetical protein
MNIFSHYVVKMLLKFCLQPYDVHIKICQLLTYLA